MLRSISIVAAMSLVLSLIFTMGCSVQTQKAKESFVDQALPQELSKLANQTHELARYQDQIIQRIKTENKNELLDVAVIDNGMDIAHPDLIGKFDYQIENEKIAGVGYDIMGQDNFPSAVLINPELFAFTAKEIKNGLIVKGDQNVFKLLIDLDQSFSDFFIAKMQQDEILKKSLFSKFTKRSFNIFGLYKLVQTAEISKNYFDPETYKANKEAKKLLSPRFRAEVVENTELQKNDLMSIYALLDLPEWSASSDSGLPSAISRLNEIENADVFMNLVKASFKEFSRTEEFKAGVSKLVTFRLGRNHSLSINQDAEFTDALGFLSTALEYQKQGSMQVDPISNVATISRFNLMSDIDFIRQPAIYPEVKMNSNSIVQSYISSINKVQIYSSLIDSIEKNTTEKYAVKSFMKQYVLSQKAADALLKLRGTELSNVYSPDFKSSYSSLYRKYHFRNSHPYLSSFGETESHGTHTSGIVAKQNENIRIYPVRITTRSALVTKEEKQNLITDYSQNFAKWLRQPLVIKAIYQKMENLRPAGVTAEPVTDAEKDLFAQKVYEILNPGMLIAFDSDPLDFIFFKELEQAMKLVASKNIKIASISLGSELNNTLPQLKDLDPEKDISAVFSFLNFEFVKFQLAEILNNEAKNTLFVVAAGNSSMWVEGKAHSALPVDLTSRFLGTFENGKDLIAPNNHVKNILGVGSLSQDEDLSAFTNILLGLKTKTLFAVGEDVLSPIKSTDLSSSLSIINKRIPNMIPPFDLSDSRIKDKIFENPNFAGFRNKSEGLTLVGSYIYYGISNLTMMVSALKMHLALTYSDHREKMSGTSMATPAVAGFIADLALSKAKKQNLPTTEIYNNPEFTPEKLIDDAFAVSTPLFDDATDINLRKVDIRGKYDRGDKAQALDVMLNQILK
jgi:subtilisin family serine protease